MSDPTTTKARTPLFGGSVSCHILGSGPKKIIRVYTPDGIFVHMLQGVHLDPDGSEADWIAHIEQALGPEEDYQ